MRKNRDSNLRRTHIKKRNRYICGVMQKLTFLNYKITNTKDVCDIYIDGIIVDASTEQIIRDWWNDETSTSFKTIRNQIDEKTVKTINVYINSQGGQVVEAMAIHDYLKQIAAKGVNVNTYGRGLVASAATYILMSGTSTTISENSWFMVHNVSGGIYGDVNDIENYAVTMRKFNDQITDFYSTHTGLPRDEIANYMNDETWFSGKDTVLKGFVKNLETGVTLSNSISKENWLFKNTEVFQAYNSSTKNEINMDLKKIGNDIKTAIIDHLKEIGVIKNETQNPLEGLDFKIENILKPISDEIDNKITKAITDLDLKPTVTEALTDAKLAKQDEVTVLKNEIESLKSEIAKTIITPGNRSTNGNEVEERRGVSWRK